MSHAWNLKETGTGIERWFRWLVPFCLASVKQTQGEGNHLRWSPNTPRWWCSFRFLFKTTQQESSPPKRQTHVTSSGFGLSLRIPSGWEIFTPDASSVQGPASTWRTMERRRFARLTGGVAGGSQYSDWFGTIRLPLGKSSLPVTDFSHSLGLDHFSGK